MSASSVEPVRGRLANVSAIVFLNGSAPESVCRARADRLRLFFEDVIYAGTGSAVRHDEAVAGESDATTLGTLAAGLEAAREDRVLVIDPAREIPEAVWFALCAWPEHPVVTARLDGALQPLCAVYQRDPAAAQARALMASGETRAEALIDVLETSVIEGDDIAPLLG